MLRVANGLVQIQQTRQRHGLSKHIAIISTSLADTVLQIMMRPIRSVLHVTQSDQVASAQLGPYQIDTLIAEDDEGCVTAYRVRIEPHQQTATSYHKVAEEIYYVISGSGLAVLDGVEYPLQVGDFLRLPPETRHCFITHEEELVMLDLHSPGSRPDRDVYFEGEVPDGFTTK